MKWPIGESANQTLLIGTAQRWELEHEAIGLLTERSLPAHLTFLTGTPAGVAFEPPTDDFIGHARQQYLLQALIERIEGRLERIETHIGMGPTGNLGHESTPVG
jgi:hypothetical protein